MAEVNPCFVLSTQTHGSEVIRSLARALRLGPGPIGTTDLSVFATSGMNVSIAFGRAIIDGTETSLQGSYIVYNDAIVAKAIATADATNPRLDLVCAKVQDQDYSGATRAWSLAVVTGTPAPSPVLPAAPANSIPLAAVTVPALAASIVSGNIADLRTVTGLGSDATKIQTLALAAAAGSRVDVARLDHVHPYTGMWRKLDDQSSASAASLTLTVPAGTYRILEVHLTGRGDQVTAQNWIMQLNTDTAANYDYQFWHDGNATLAGLAPAIAGTGWRAGGLPPTSAVAGAHGQSKVTIENADSTSMRKTYQYNAGRWDSDAAAGADYEAGHGQWRNAANAVTSILVKSSTGNVLNARAILMGASW